MQAAGREKQVVSDIAHSTEMIVSGITTHDPRHTRNPAHMYIHYPQVLDDLEQRVLAMRASMLVDHAVKPGTAGGKGTGAGTGSKGAAPSHKSALEEIEEELGRPGRRRTETCSACGKVLLPGFLAHHAAVCSGVKQVYDYDNMPDDDAGAMQQERNATLRILQDAEARREAEIAVCPLCSRKFKRDSMGTHVPACCEKLRLRVKQMIPKSTRKNPHATIPTAPAELKCLWTSPTAIALAWKAPVFDGGAPITQYEIQYGTREPIIEARRIRGYELIPKPPIFTTRWHVASPIAASGFNITGLPSSTEFNAFKVRAYNDMGASPWSEVLDSLVTAAPRASSCPLHLRLQGEPTFHSATLRWEEPLTTGGTALTGYELRYKQEVVDYSTMLATGNAVKVKIVDHIEFLPPGETVHVMKHLRYNCNYRDIVLFALNSEGQSPRSNVIPIFTTPDTDRGEQLKYDLRAARESTEMTMDVMYQGFHQRFSKEAYIELLEQELRRWLERSYIRDGAKKPSDAEITGMIASFRLPDDPGSDSDDELPESAPSAASSPGRLSTPGSRPASAMRRSVRPQSAQTHSTLPHEETKEDRMMRVKRTQFGYKIGQLEDEVAETQRRIDDIHVRRVTLRDQMVRTEARVKELQATLTMTRSFKGKRLDTEVVTGQKTRYDRPKLLSLLQTEIDKTTQLLANLTSEQMAGVVSEEKLSTSLARLNVMLSERRVAFFRFEKNYEKRGHATTALFRWGNQLLMRAFNTWADATRQSNRSKELMRRVLRRMMNHQKAEAWNQWLWYVEQSRRIDAQYAAAEQQGTVIGRGSKLLLKAQNHRQANIRGFAGMLQLVDDLRTGLDKLTQGSKTELVATRKEAAGMELLDKAALRQVRDDGPMDAESLREAAARAAAVMRWKQIDGIMQQVLGLTGQRDALESIRQGDSGTIQLMEATGSLEAVSQVLHDDEPGDAMEGAELGMSTDEILTVLIQQGGGLALQRKYRAAEGVLRKAERAFGRARNALGLLQVYRRLSPMYEAEEKWERAIIHYQRMLELSRSVDDGHQVASALEGIGRCLIRRAEFRLARRTFEEAGTIWMSRRDFSAASRVYRCIGEANYLLGHIDQANAWKMAAEKFEQELQHRVDLGHGLLDSMQTRLQSALVSHAQFLALENTSPMVPLIRVRKRLLLQELEALHVLLDTARAFNERETARLDEVKDELDRVMKTGARRVASKFVHKGNTQMFDVEVLREKLRDEVARLESETNQARQDTTAYSTRIENAEAALKDTEEHLAAESNGLALKAFQTQVLRRIAFNTANQVVNDVTGRASGGAPMLAGVVDKTAFVYSLDDGQAMNCFLGDLEQIKHRPRIGHVKRITVVALYGDSLYTGAADGTVRGWNVALQRPYGRPRKPVRVGMSANEDVEVPPFDLHTEEGRYQQSGQFAAMEGGHDCTVWSLAATPQIVASGGADGTVQVWHARTGARLRTLKGHTASVLSIVITPDYIVTGGADAEVRVWQYAGTQAQPVRKLSLLHRLLEHSSSITCVSMLSTNVVSGDRRGEIIVWDCVAGVAARKFRVHTAAVLAIQFDATKVITASADGSVRITDIISGALMAVPVRDAQPPVMSLQYDTHMLVCGSADHTVRKFRFSSAGDRVMQKQHLLQPDESVADVAAMYGCTSKDILEWNSALAPSQFYPGRQIIVQPPEVESQAEAMLSQYEQAKDMMGKLQKDDKYVAARLTQPGGTVELPIR